jgi:hypothetical protein
VRTIVLYDGSLLPMFEELFCYVNGPVDKKCLYVEFLAKYIYRCDWSHVRSHLSSATNRALSKKLPTASAAASARELRQ